MGGERERNQHVIRIILVAIHCRTVNLFQTFWHRSC